MKSSYDKHEVISNYQKGLNIARKLTFGVFGPPLL